MLKIDQHDSCQPNFWRNRWLSYTDHAIVQAGERKIELLGHLPVDRIRLADCDLTWHGIGATVWKYLGNESSQGEHFLVIRNNGEVITVFRIDETWQDVCLRKSYRRQIMGRMSWRFLEDIVSSAEALWAEALTTERSANMLLYREQCREKEVDKMRRRRRQREKHGKN